MAGRTDFTLGDAIAKARNTSGMDQERLAELLGVSPKTVGRWERDVNRIPFETMVLIAQITDRDVSWFAEFVPVEPQPTAARPASAAKTKTASSGTKTARRQPLRPNPCSIDQRLLRVA